MQIYDYAIEDLFCLARSNRFEYLFALAFSQAPLEVGYCYGFGKIFTFASAAPFYCSLSSKDGSDTDQPLIHKLAVNCYWLLGNFEAGVEGIVV